MGAFPVTKPDPLIERIEQLEFTLNGIMQIFNNPNMRFVIRGLYVTKRKTLKVEFEAV